MLKKNMTLGRRMQLGQGLLTGFLVLVGAMGVLTVNSLKNSLDIVAKMETRKLDLAGSVDSAVSAMVAANRGMVLSGLTGETNRIESYAQQVDEHQRIVDSGLKEIESILFSSEGKVLIAELQRLSADNKRASSEMVAAIRGQRYDEATKLLADRVRPIADAMDEKSMQFVVLQRKLLAERIESSQTRASVANAGMIAVVIAAAVIAILLFRSILGSNRTLRQICAEIAEGARQVASASKQVSSASSALAQGSSEQAASLEETSASTEEINSMTQKNAENASTAARETENADNLLAETTQKLDQMIASMKEINTSSEKISRIIRVIDEIAFQTNILALNAAVEAARAGEAGMGFAVVADEVRNLAQRCAQAAKDTSDLIEESIVRSQEGKGKLDDVSAWVNRVVDNASRIKVLANEVHMGSQEQARGIEQIARAVSQMQQVTQSTAASAEESASAGEEMSAQAANLNDAVNRLSGLVGAGEEMETVSARTAPTGLRAGTPARSAPARRESRPTAKAAARDSFPLEGDFRDF
jgi:methyl-accepting chemotaxis protein/methyl-accepting chemotaxis protein-1 (serine sensor receptor)